MSDLLDALSTPIPGKSDNRRDVYRAKAGGWYIAYAASLPTYLRREYSRREVDAEVAAGTIREKYSNSHDCFWTGKIIDVEATVSARNEHGKHAPIIYVET